MATTTGMCCLTVWRLEARDQGVAGRCASSEGCARTVWQALLHGPSMAVSARVILHPLPSACLSAPTFPLFARTAVHVRLGFTLMAPF